MRMSRSAVQEIVVQLHRMQPLRLMTAKKGATATYTLDEFFGEQTRYNVSDDGIKNLVRIRSRSNDMIFRNWFRCVEQFPPVA